jgi:hypothetical protein
MNSGLFAKIRKWIIRLAWVPLIFGVAGYHFVGDVAHGTMGFWEAVYATIALYFMNPDSDISNVYVLAAKYTSFLVVADVMFAVFEAMHNSFKHLISNRFADSTAVYTDNEDWGRVIADYWKHSYFGEEDRHPDRLERAKNHIIMFEDDMKNLEVYNRCRKYLRDRHTYIMLNNTDPFLVKELDDQYLHYFNIYELMARKYWKDYDLYEVMTSGNKAVYKIAITDFGKAGEALFRYGYINNVYTSTQQIEYHIWGASTHQKKLLMDINKQVRAIEGCDNIICHDNDPLDDIDVLKDMSRIIISMADDRELLQELFHSRVEGDIYYFSNRDVLMDDIYKKKVISFGHIKDILTEEYIRQDLLSRQGMLFNYDYSLRISGRNAGSDYEEKMKSEWAKLDGFVKGSNLARADHYWIEKKLLDEGKADIREVTIIEHNRWCRYHIINRWVFGGEKDREKGLHPLLVPFDELSKEEQDKDDIYDPKIKEEIEKLI